LAVSFASGVIFVLAVGLANLPAPFIMLPIFGAGAAMIGSQLGANAMVAALYPARIRSTGVGWALGIGRVGSIIGPLLGGALLSFEHQTRRVFWAAAIPVLIASIAGFLASRVQSLKSLGSR
jgi:MFS transporter, AAHS family, 4-hydroxybenzoate transporter